MTTENKPAADVAPGRIGLKNRIDDVKGRATDDNGKEGTGTPPPKKETRGRKSKADKEAVQDAEWADLARYATNLIKQPVDAYAQEIDPYLVELGYPDGTTFAMKPEEEKGTEMALKIVISKINPEMLAKWAPWIICGGIILQLTVPRFLMITKIRAYIAEKKEKETASVDTTAKKLDDNAK